ncbi:MAG: ABC transporter ATP-binding protein [Rhodospirillales bacterium]
MAAVIETKNLAVAFGEEGSQETIFHNVNISIEEGEFVTLVGVSGAGKSTMLRVISDLIHPKEGSIQVNTVQVADRRPISMVFQAANLMPWRTIAQNIQLGLEGIEISNEEKQKRTDSTLSLVGLPDVGDRWPYQLSGGQRQRIGIARALAVEPAILLMDEPFGALDAITRTSLQDELLRIWSETKKSILFVTHDIEEAVYLGDRVLLLGDKPAHIVQDFKIDIDRDKRRDSEAFLKKVEEVKAGLHGAIALTANGNSSNNDH